MENIWFYSLSALSQVMAAIISFFGVFVVFKLQALNENISLQRKKAVIHIISAVNKTPGDADINAKNTVNKKFRDDNKLTIYQANYLKYSDLKICKIFNQLWEIPGMDFDRHLVDEKNNVYYFYNESSYKNFENAINEKKIILSKLSVSLLFCAISIATSLFFLSSPFSVKDFGYQEYNLYLLFPLILFSCFTIFFIAWNIYSISKK
ncbi:MAG: hypothetical protein WC304_01560 [Candidatus Gracilibacteria bacterium]|jgi:hypothetical protein